MLYRIYRRIPRVMFMWHPAHAPHWPVFSAREDSGRVGRIKLVNSDTENNAWGRCWWSEQ